MTEPPKIAETEAVIAIVPTTSSGSALPLAGIGGQAATQGWNRFGSALAAAQSSLSSPENEETGNGSLPDGSQEIGSTENNPGTGSLRTGTLQAGAGNPSSGYESNIAGAKTTTSAQPRLANSRATNATSSKTASGNSPASSVASSAGSSGAVSAPAATVAHALQTAVVLVPADAPQPISSQPGALPFALPQSGATEVRAQETVIAAMTSPATTQPLPHSSAANPAPSLGFAPISSNAGGGAQPVAGMVGYAGPNAAANQTNVGSAAAAQSGTTPQTAGGSWSAGDGVLGQAQISSRTSAQDSTTMAEVAPPISGMAASASQQNLTQTARQNSDGSSSPPATLVAENAPELSFSDSGTAVPPAVNFMSASDSSSGMKASAGGAEATPAISVAVDRASEPASLASTFSSEITAGISAGENANSPSPQAISAESSSADPNDPAAQRAAGVSQAEDADSARNVASILSSLAGAGASASVAAKTLLQVPGQTPTTAAPGAHAATGNSSTPPAAAATASGLRAQAAQIPVAQSASATQTPFSVFFSDPASATDSAASVLPKMILPASFSGAASHGSQASATSGTGVAPQISSSHSESKTGTTQPGSASAAKPTPTENANAPATQAGHSNADSNTNADVASVEPAAAQVPAAPVTAQMNLPANGQTAPAPNSPPQLPTQPTNGAASSAPAPNLPAALASSVSETGAPAPVLGAVQAAQLLNRAGQSEMRIGLNTTAFGSVEVRTTVRTSDVGLVIGSEKGDLHTLLANELPAVANTLQQQNLRLGSVNFTQGFGSSNNASGGGNGQQQRGFVPMQTAGEFSSTESLAEEMPETAQFAAWSGGSNLSVLA